MGCARCHDHKYDPIPHEGLLRAGRRVPQHRYHEYPLAPKAVVDEYKAKEKQLKRKREMLNEFTSTESRQLAETLAFQTVEVHAGGVAGERRAEEGQARDRREGEARLRALRSLAAVSLASGPSFYPFLKDWQALIARAARRRKPTKLADEFQDLLVDVFIEQRELKKENDIIMRAGAADQQAEGAAPTCPTSSRPTTTSALAADSSSAA